MQRSVDFLSSRVCLEKKEEEATPSPKCTKFFVISKSPTEQEFFFDVGHREQKKEVAIL